jgi:hypothetical protein
MRLMTWRAVSIGPYSVGVPGRAAGSEAVREQGARRAAAVRLRAQRLA